MRVLLLVICCCACLAALSWGPLRNRVERLHLETRFPTAKGSHRLSVAPGGMVSVYRGGEMRERWLAGPCGPASFTSMRRS